MSLKRILLILLCLALLVLPAAADEAKADVTSYSAVCTVSADGSCDVLLTLSVNLPREATSFLLPLPLEAERISTPGLSATQSVQETCIFLLLENPNGFSSSDEVVVSYHLPQLVEAWDGKQTMTLPLLFDNWNCKISLCSIQVVLPGEADGKLTVVDAEGDRIKNFLTESVEDSTVTLELRNSFTPRFAALEMVFNDGYFALPDDSEDDADPTVTRINSVTEECTVADDSSCFVSVTAEYSFAGNPDTVRIPVPKDAYDVSMDGARISSQKIGNSTVLLLKNPAGFEGTQSYHITYRLLTTAVRQNGEQLFSLPLILPQWDYSIRTFSLSLTMPAEYEGLPEFYSSYYNDQISNYLNIVNGNAKIEAQSFQPLMEQESLRVELTLPDGYFDLRFLQGRFSGIETAAFWIAAALCLIYWFFFLRIRIRRIEPQSNAPLGCNAGQIPYLLRMKPPSLSLMAADWAGLGYLAMERTAERQTMLLARMDMGNERSRSEAMIFSSLFHTNPVCRVRSPVYLAAAQRCISETKNDWRGRLAAQRRNPGRPAILEFLGFAAAAFAALNVFDSLVTLQSFRWLLIVPLSFFAMLAAVQLQKLPGLHFERHPQRLRIVLYALLIVLLVFGIRSGCLGVMFLNCLLQYLIGVVLLPGGKRTQGGTELFYQLLGLRKYLRKLDASSAEVILRNDPQFFYRMAPYAEALGVGPRFAKTFAGMHPEPCLWLAWKGQLTEGTDEFYTRFSAMLDRMDNAPAAKRKK